MTDKQKDFVVELTAGAILLLLGVFVFATDWSNWVKAVVVAAAVALAIICVVVLTSLGQRVRRWLNGRSSATLTPAPPTLAEQLDETWFVTFTSGPYHTGPDDREQYATAIAAVDRVEGESVSLQWRDDGAFPTTVPVKLLEAREVYRFRNGGDAPRRVRVRNDGLYSPSPGGVITGSGWRAHRGSPHRIAFARYRDLSTGDQQVMERDADLDTYDLDSIP